MLGGAVALSTTDGHEPVAAVPTLARGQGGTPVLLAMLGAAVALRRAVGPIRSAAQPALPHRQAIDLARAVLNPMRAAAEPLAPVGRREHRAAQTARARRKARGPAQQRRHGGGRQAQALADLPVRETL